jgi:hypothetical protein
MDNTNLPKQNNRLGTVMALGLGGLIIWNLLPPDWKENISRGIYQVSAELAAAQRRKAEQERIAQSTIAFFQKLSLTLPKPSGELLLPLSGVNTIPLISDNQTTQPQTCTKTDTIVNPDSIRLQLFSKCSFNPMSVIGYDVG